MLDTIPATAALLAIAGLSGRAALALWRRLQEIRQARRGVEAARQALLTRVGDAARAHARPGDSTQQGWEGWRRFVVVRKVSESPGVRSFHLRPLDGRPLPTFRPGQYLTFRLHVPGQPRPVTRCYSLSDAPRRDIYRITVKRIGPTPEAPKGQPGVASCFLHDDVDVGNVLEVRAPAGAFWLEPADPTPVVLIGGGIGVTPVLAMLLAIVETGLPRPVWFFHGVRNGADHAMADTLAEVAAREAAEARALHRRRGTRVDLAEQVAGLEDLQAGIEGLSQRVHDLARAPSGAAEGVGAAAVGAIAVDQAADVELDHAAFGHSGIAAPG